MTTCSNSAVKDHDVLNIFFYGDIKNYSDTYLYFADSQIKQKETGEVSLTLMKNGYDANWNLVSTPFEGGKVVLTDSEGKQVAEGTTDKDGVVTFTIAEAGSYRADVTEAPLDYFVSAHADITIGDSQVVDPDDPSKDDTKKDDQKDDDQKKDNASQDLNKNKTTLQTAAGGNNGSGDGSASGSSSGGSAKTGDDMQVALWMMAVLVSLAAAVYIYAAAQRRDSRF